MAVLQPVGEIEHLVGRAGGEAGGSSVGKVGAEIHGRGRRTAAVLGVVEGLVLGHHQNPAGAGLDGVDGGTQQEATLCGGRLLVEVRLGAILFVEVDARVYLVATAVPVGDALLFRGPQHGERRYQFGDVVAGEVRAGGVQASVRRRAELDGVFDLGGDSLVMLLLADVLQLEHRIQDLVPADLVRRIELGVAQVLEVGPLHDGHEAGRLGESDILRVDAEVLHRR